MWIQFKKDIFVWNDMYFKVKCKAGKWKQRWQCSVKMDCTQAWFWINKYFRCFVSSHYWAKSNCITHRHDVVCHQRKMKLCNDQQNRTTLWSKHSVQNYSYLFFQPFFFSTKSKWSRPPEPIVQKHILCPRLWRFWKLRTSSTDSSV